MSGKAHQVWRNWLWLAKLLCQSSCLKIEDRNLLFEAGVGTLFLVGGVGRVEVASRERQLLVRYQRDAG